MSPSTAQHALRALAWAAPRNRVKPHLPTIAAVGTVFNTNHSSFAPAWGLQILRAGTLVDIGSGPCGNNELEGPLPLFR